MHPISAGLLLAISVRYISNIMPGFIQCSCSEEKEERAPWTVSSSVKMSKMLQWLWFTKQHLLKLTDG
jgi:hypothetical protein